MTSFRVEVRAPQRRAVAEWGWWRRAQLHPYSYAFTPLGLRVTLHLVCLRGMFQRLKEDKKVKSV